MRVSHVRVREFLNPCTTSMRELLTFRNISLSECCARSVLVFLNIFIRHTAGRMYGDILLAECSSAFSGLWCLRTALGGEPSRRLGCRCTGAPRIPHSDLIRLRMCEDILLSECSSAYSGLWCRWTVLGGEPSGRLGCRCTGAPRIPHSDFRNPVCELYRPGGRWSSRVWVSRPCGRSVSRPYGR